MAKMVVQNALFGDSWSMRSLVLPACMYTEPELAEVWRKPPGPVRALPPPSVALPNGHIPRKL